MLHPVYYHSPHCYIVCFHSLCHFEDLTFFQSQLLSTAWTTSISLAEGVSALDFLLRTCSAYSMDIAGTFLVWIWSSGHHRHLRYACPRYVSHERSHSFSRELRIFPYQLSCCRRLGPPTRKSDAHALGTIVNPSAVVSGVEILRDCRLVVIPMNAQNVLASSYPVAYGPNPLYHSLHKAYSKIPVIMQVWKETQAGPGLQCKGELVRIRIRIRLYTDATWNPIYLVRAPLG